MSVAPNRNGNPTPFVDASTVTKSDSTVLAPTKALYIGGTGDVAVTMQSGASVVFKAVPVGVTLYISVTQVLSTSTTATLILALY